jgi:hypothetical protein
MQLHVKEHLIPQQRRVFRLTPHSHRFAFDAPRIVDIELDRFAGKGRGQILSNVAWPDRGRKAPEAAVLPVVSRTTRLWVLRGPRVGWRSALLQDTQRREYDRAHSSRNSESASAAAAGPLLSVIARFAG